MKKYLLTVESNDEKVWESFKKTYREKGHGNNLDEAILTLIRKDLGANK